MDKLNEAYGLLEQAIGTLEMINNFGKKLVNLDELMERSIKKIAKAQELIQHGPK